MLEIRCKKIPYNLKRGITKHKGQWNWNYKVPVKRILAALARICQELEMIGMIMHDHGKFSMFFYGFWVT